MNLTRLVVSLIATLAMSVAAMGQSGQYCGNGTWADNCGNASIIVENVRGPGFPCLPGSVSITLGQSGGWVITVVACGGWHVLPLH